jgi:hypothetical protein
MAQQIVPLTSSPNQVLTTTLTVNRQQLTVQLRVAYNPQGGFWTMDIADKLGNPILYAVPLITGMWPGANILGPYEYLNIGSAYVINQNGAASDFPNNTDLGVDFVLLWADND